MKTIKKTACFALVAGIIIFCAIISKQSVNNVKTVLKESTHQGYRTMVADFIF